MSVMLWPASSDYRMELQTLRKHVWVVGSHKHELQHESGTGGYVATNHSSLCNSIVILDGQNPISFFLSPHGMVESMMHNQIQQ